MSGIQKAVFENKNEKNIKIDFLFKLNIEFNRIIFNRML